MLTVAEIEGKEEPEVESTGQTARAPPRPTRRNTAKRNAAKKRRKAAAQKGRDETAAAAEAPAPAPAPLGPVPDESSLRTAWFADLARRFHDDEAEIEANAAVDAATTHGAERLGYEEARYPPPTETVIELTASQGGASAVALSRTEPLPAPATTTFAAGRLAWLWNKFAPPTTVPEPAAVTIPKEPGQVKGTGRGSTGHEAPLKGILKTTSAFPRAEVIAPASSRAWERGA